MSERPPASGDAEAWDQIVRVTRLMHERGLTDLCGGNVSLRLGGRVYITPCFASEYFLWDLDASNIQILDEDGGLVHGKVENLSRETDIHLAIYRTCAEAHAVIHVHTPAILAVAEPGPVGLDHPALKDFLETHRILLRTIDPSLAAQTPAHNDAVLAALSGRDPGGAAIIIGPRHGIFAVAPDLAANFAAVDGLDCHLKYLRLKRAVEGAIPCC